MEGVPRMPMINIEPRNPITVVEFGPKIKQYISRHYQEDPASYDAEIGQFNELRQSALVLTADIQSCSRLKKYYAQLCLLKSRFPMHTGDEVAIPFSWMDHNSCIDIVPGSMTSDDVNFELCCVLYNIGALHSWLGQVDLRTTAEGMKVACTHFQCAAWAFQFLRDGFQCEQYSMDFERNVLSWYISLMLAQAQECILEKSLIDNRKHSIIAKVAVQVAEFYKLAYKAVSHQNVADVCGGSRVKQWSRTMQSKFAYYEAIAMHSMALQAEEAQQWGTRLAYCQAASSLLADAIKSGAKETEVAQQALQFTNDVINGKFQNAKKENDFIYHEHIPDIKGLPEVKGAVLVKPIAFDPLSNEVSGDDIFGKLIPLNVHQAASVYSEEKAKLLREQQARIDQKNEQLVSYLSSIQIEQLGLDGFGATTTALPTELIETCATVNAKAVDADRISTILTKLMTTHAAVRADIDSASVILKSIEVEIENDTASDLHVGFKKHFANFSAEQTQFATADERGHSANEELVRIFDDTRSMFLKLAMPLSQLQQQLPPIPSDGASSDEGAALKRILGKVEEMKQQREQFMQDLRDLAHGDDITKVLLSAGNTDPQTIFGNQLKKYGPTSDLITQNMNAQENIFKALTEANANYVVVRRKLGDSVKQRQDFIQALLAAFDTMVDVSDKASKGVTFYEKLVGAVAELKVKVETLRDELDKAKERATQKERDLAKQREEAQQALNQPKPLPSLSLPVQHGVSSVGVGAVGEPTTETGQVPADSGRSRLKDYMEFYRAKKGGAIPVSGLPQNSALDSALPVAPMVSNVAQYVPSSNFNPVNTSVYQSQQGSGSGSVPQSGPSQGQPAQFQNVPPPLPVISSISGATGATAMPQSNGPPYSSSGSQWPSAHQIPYSNINTNSHISQPQYPSYTAPVIMSSPMFAYASYNENNYSTINAATQHYPMATGASVTAPTQIHSSNPAVPNVAPIVSAPGPSQYPPPSITPAGIAVASSYHAASVSSNSQMGNAYAAPQSQPQRFQVNNYIPSMALVGSHPVVSTQQRPSQPHYQQPSLHVQPQHPPIQSQYQAVYAHPQQPPIQSLPQHPSGAPLQLQSPVYTQPSVGSHTQRQPVYGPPPIHTRPQQPSYHQQPVSYSQPHQPSALSQPQQQPIYSQPHQLQSSVHTQPQQPIQQQQSAQSSQQQQQPVFSQSQQPSGLSQPQQQPIYSQSHQLLSAVHTQQQQPIQQHQPAQSSQQQQQPVFSQSQQPSGLSQPPIYSQPQQPPLQQQPAPPPQQQQPVYSQSEQPPVHNIQNITGSYSVGPQPYSQGYNNTPSNYSSAGGFAAQALESMRKMTEAAGSSMVPASVSTVQNLLASMSISSVQTGPHGSIVRAENQPSNVLPNAQYAQYRPATQQHSQQFTAPTDSTAYYVPTNAASTVAPRPVFDGFDKPVNDAGLPPPLLPVARPTAAQPVLVVTAKQEPTPAKKAPAFTNGEAKRCSPNIPSKPVEVMNTSGDVSQQKPKLESKMSNGSVSKLKPAGAATTHIPTNPFLDDEILNAFAAEVEKFEKYVEGMSKPSLNGPTPLEKLWKNLSENNEAKAKQQSISAARCSHAKNRNNDYLPYDSNRILLNNSADRGNDYINASRIKRFDDKFCDLIVTDVPISHTINDFWWMVFEQQVELLVTTVPVGSCKPVFWPAEKGEKRQCGSLCITLQTLRPRDDWIERVFVLFEESTRLTRSVIQLHLLEWPATGLPESPRKLLRLAQELMSFYRQQRNPTFPVAVVCDFTLSCGGVFCALCVALQHISISGSLPKLNDVIANLNSQRRSLLQSASELQFVYAALLYNAQGILMQRGILTNRTSFTDTSKSNVTVSAASRTHSRTSSQDLLGGTNIHSIQSLLMRDETKSGVGSTNNSAPISPVLQSKVLETPKLDSMKMKRDTISNGDGQHNGENVPNSDMVGVTRITDPKQFNLGEFPTKKKITKNDFLARSNVVPFSGKGSSNDPFSGMDPMWVLKKDNK